MLTLHIVTRHISRMAGNHIRQQLVGRVDVRGWTFKKAHEGKLTAHKEKVTDGRVTPLTSDPRVVPGIGNLSLISSSNNFTEAECDV